MNSTNLGDKDMEDTGQCVHEAHDVKSSANGSHNVEVGLVKIEKEYLEMIETAKKTVFVLVLHFNDLFSGIIDLKRAKLVAIALHEVIKYISKLNEDKRRSFVNDLLEDQDNSFVAGLGIYFMHHWMDEKPCLDPLCDQFTHLTCTLLTTLSDMSQAAKSMVVEMGIVSSLLQALVKLKNVSFSDVVESKALSTLIILGNCSKKAIQYHEFDNARGIIKILTPFLKSTELKIRMAAHAVAVHLNAFVAGHDISKLSLTQTEVDELIKALKAATESQKLCTNAFGVNISAEEILSQLNLSLISESNLSLILNGDILKIIPCILKVDHEDTVTAAISFVWTITCRTINMDTVPFDLQQQLLNICAILENISSKSLNPDLAECTLLALKPDLLKDVDLALKYVEVCYKHDRFTECLRVANRFQQPSALLYKAKCFFKRYRGALSTYEHEKQQNVQNYLSILKDAKATVSLLGTALDKHSIDYEGKQQLDIAMMDVIRGLNELYKVTHPHCMLCLQTDVSLQKSHVYPRSLLKLIADTTEEREGGKVFTMANALSPKWHYHYSSPKDVRFFMLCSKCEDVVNKGGENDFFQNFFSQLYDSNGPCQLMEDTTVAYGPWLYNFCISLVFRCIAATTGIPEVVNKYEIYDLFLNCRKFLLSSEKLNEDALPSVYFFVNSIEVPQQYEHCCIQEALTSPGYCTIQTTDLSEGHHTRPLKGHYILVHCGIINVLIKFSPANEALLPCNWKINPQAGEYTVPAEINKDKYIPEGVWTAFEEISKSFYDHITKSLFRKKDKPPREIKSQSSEGVEHQHIKHSTWNLPESYLDSPKSNTVISMLPAGFEIDCISSEVVLPQGYSLLLHSTFVSATTDEANITLLIGIKESAKSIDLDKLVRFVVLCRLASIGAFFVGYSISFDKDIYQYSSLCETDLVHASDEIQRAEKDAKSFIINSLPNALREKGFVNLKSLMYNHIHNSFISSLDMKCPMPSHCWYCKDLCENCLSYSAFGRELKSQSNAGISLKFCDHHCAQYFMGPNKKQMVLNVEIFAPKKQDDSHIYTPIAQIVGSGKMAEDGVLVTCLICHGYFSEDHPNGRFFVHCQQRSLFNQKVMEMFINENGMPEQPLPHADCTVGVEMVRRFKDNGNIHIIIASALQHLIESIDTKSEELNLHVVTKYQGSFFDKKHTQSVKLTNCKLTVQPNAFHLDDIPILFQKFSELQDKLFTQRKVDIEISSSTKRLLLSLQHALPSLPKDNELLYRLLHFSFKFFAEIIRGLQHCRGEMCLTVAGGLLNEVWITTIKVMVHTSRRESCMQTLKEAISTLMDHFSMTITPEDKSESSYYQDVLLGLLSCCAKSNIFREFISLETMVTILQPVLNKHGSGVRLFSLLILSFFIDDETPEEHKNLLNLEVLDIQLLRINLVMNVVTAADALHLIKTSMLVPSNIQVLRSSNFQTIASEFIDKEPEGKLAVEIISAVQTCPKDNTEKENVLTSPDELLVCILPILTNYNKSVTPENYFNSESGNSICQKMQDLKNSLQKNTMQQLASIPKDMLETAAKELSLYIRRHLLDVDDRFSPKCIEMLHSCGTILINMCRFSSSGRVAVINEKLASKVLNALEIFKDCESPSQDILARIFLCLILLHLCLKEALKQHVFINAHNVALALLGYYNTRYRAVWMFAKLNMMHLGEFLDIKVHEVLELTEEALTEFISNLSEATNPFSPIEIFGCELTGNEILTFLEEATLLEKNSERMINVELLQYFPELLQNLDSQTQAARLLWVLAQRPEIRQRINEEASLLQEIIEQSINDSRSELLQLVLMCLKGVKTYEFSKILKYVEGCFKYNMWTECVMQCEHILSHECSPDDIKDDSRVLLAKSQFKQYRRLQQILSMKPYADQEFINLHDTCYGLAREVIRSFKIVSQKSGFKFDDESLKVFYIALMDMSREGNESLKKFHYCLLCKRNKMELQHSHVIPKSILECFAASMGQTVGKKVFKAINYPRKKRFRYFASKELAFYIFCKKCENIFNDGGEKGFLSFFQEIYNSEDSGTLEKEHKLEYGEWLYHFCIGLIFRGIATSTGIPDYMESEKVYQYFLKCCRFLLNEYSLDSLELPEIYILFNPTTVPKEYELLVLKQILISPGFFFCDDISLSNGLCTEPPVAQFMVAHIGIINILVSFTNEADLGEYKVVPSGGTCIIPCDSERTLPKGIWEMFGSLSSDFRREMQESFFHKQDKLPLPIQTVETESKVNTQKAFKMVSAQIEDKQFFTDQCEQESSATLSLLPETFRIVRESSIVSLPSDHHLLLHLHTAVENDKGSTALIGLYVKKGQPIKPFAIHYQFSPTTLFCVGFYLTQTGEVEKLICDSPLDGYSTVKAYVEKVQTSIPISLPAILNAKGFVNMESLIYNYNHSTFECPFDTKCPIYPRCWYCRDRCENCLKRATALEPLSITVNKVPLKFCGEECKAVFCGPRNSPIRILALATRRSHKDTEKIEDGHSEICCMAGQGIIDGEGLRFKISVRVGYQTSTNPKGRYYCIFTWRTLFSQQFAELFLHRDTSPDCPLPHVNDVKGQRQVQKLRDEEVLQSFIQAGFRAVKRQHQSNLSTTSTHDSAGEEIPASSVKMLIASDKECDSVQKNNHEVKLAQPELSPLSVSENFYETFLRLHIPDLPSLHTLIALLPEELIRSIAKSWKKFISSSNDKESSVSQLYTQVMAFLLQVTDDVQVPLAVMDATVFLLHKLCQHATCRQNIDISLILVVIAPALAMQKSSSRIYAMTLLSGFIDQSPEEVKKQILLTKEDVEVIAILANIEEEICDVLSFIEIAMAVEHNVHEIQSCGGLELLEKVIELFEADNRIVSRAALLIETLLSEKK